jgi:hypothetical protein
MSQSTPSLPGETTTNADSDDGANGDGDDVPRSPLTGEPVPEVVRENPILRNEIWGKMHLHADNWMGAICGETGSGKSYAALRLAEVIDPGFDVDQIAFNVVEFLELVTDDSYGPGSVIVFEEASVDAGSEEYMSKKNQALRQVAETWRHQRRGLIFTYPAFQRLDTDVRARCEGLMQMRELRENQGISIASYLRLQQNADSGKIYRHRPTYNGRDWPYLTFQKPSEELLHEYEARKEEFTGELNQELLQDLLAEQGDGQPDDTPDERADPKQVVQEILSGELEQYIADSPGGKYIDRDLIKFDYDVSEAESKQIKKEIKRREGLQDVM